jgi:hypothetical protein
LDSRFHASDCGSRDQEAADKFAGPFQYYAWKTVIGEMAKECPALVDIEFVIGHFVNLFGPIWATNRCGLRLPQFLSYLQLFD